MKFKELRIGQTFDWLDDDNPTFNSFYLTCVKISERRYQDEKGTIHQVGSVTAKVFHVGKTNVPRTMQLTDPRSRAFRENCNHILKSIGF